MREAAGGAGPVAGAGGHQGLAVSSEGLQSLKTSAEEVESAVEKESAHADDSTSTAQRELSAKSLLLAGALSHADEVWSTRRKTLLKDLGWFPQALEDVESQFTETDEGLRAAVHSIPGGGEAR